MSERHYYRIEHEGQAHFAERHGQELRLLSAAPWLDGAPTGVSVGRAGARLLAPVTPSKILGIGRNYAAHAQELGNEPPKQPLVFLKPPSSVVGPDAEVVLPHQSQRVDYEGEVGVVIGRRARHLTPERALEHVFGYTAVCDLTARDLQKLDGQWARAKGFDGFCPVGPSVCAGLEPSRLAVSLSVDGERRQHGRLTELIFSIPSLLVWLSAAMTLEPGDLIVTGTPEGVGPLSPGSAVTVEVAPLEPLCFRCVADPLSPP